MRSFAEIKFRVRQEAANVYLLATNPHFKGHVDRRLSLPDPETIVSALHNSEYAHSIEQLAEQIIKHRFPVLGTEIQTGPEINWRRDYLHGKESGPAYFRRIPYLNFEAVGDHKVIWELSRHQHLVLLAQTYIFTRNQKFLIEICTQLNSWLKQNPFQRGINWASALEVAFRTLSWIWLYHLIGQEMPEPLRRSFLTNLYRHGRHLKENLSVYFSPNTHLLGEAVALYALATLFPEFPNATEWRKESEDVVIAQLDFQVHCDGSHFEQSSYYHVYALDFFLFFYILAGKPESVKLTLERMAEYLYWLLGPVRRISFWGDDDGGRFFHPYGDRDQFGRATLATCGVLFGRGAWTGTPVELAEQAVWWLGPDSLHSSKKLPSTAAVSRNFENSGLVFLVCGDFYLQMDCGPFGYGGAGHSHSDTLSLTLQYCGQSIFVDPGTYVYVGDLQERNWFRGSVSHNTIQIDGRDQGESAGPFRWLSKPQVELRKWSAFSGAGGYIDAVCHYNGFSHYRRVLLQKDRLLVLDEMNGPAGNHTCEQRWQLSKAMPADLQLAFSAPADSINSQISPAYGAKQPAECLVVKQSGPFPIKIAMLLTTSQKPHITPENAEDILSDFA